MKPSSRAKYAAAITLAKGKMYEYRVPVTEHLKLPPDLDLEQQFPPAVGTLGDFAAETVAELRQADITVEPTTKEDVMFAAHVFQAFDESRLNPALSFDLQLLATAAFYLAEVPGSVAVLCQRLSDMAGPVGDELATAVRWALDKPWVAASSVRIDSRVYRVLNALHQHFVAGDGPQLTRAEILALQRWAYEAGTPHELLLADLLGAIAAMRLARSAWTLLPEYSGLTVEQWKPYLMRATAIREMWPSQQMLGKAGLYAGSSAVVQMPTSAGKTRAMELVIRASFLSGRTALTVIVAPFRALCQEIANSLRVAFREDGYQVNQLSDALQSDYLSELREFFDNEVVVTPHVVVLTPEKLLYVLRQEPKLVERIGLIVYDEGHQFDNGSRGVTYELLLTSIKRLLKESAQTVLISAVIQNAAALASWLLTDAARVVSDNRLQTRRMVAFTSLPLGATGQLQFNQAQNGDQPFFVPRVIVTEQLTLRPGESALRHFPEKKSRSIALYLALRLVPNGGVAIFAGTKVSAAKIVSDAAEEVFPRGVSLAPPSNYSDAEELTRLSHLFEMNFGSDSYLTHAAKLGIFAHHGSTPHGVRLAIEHAMRDSLIRLVVCTSTLAQGVNLPIRYLLITNTMQGGEEIKARDFHNLMGRAGRAGMYDEGTVIFTEPKLYDQRLSESRKWQAVQQLLQPENTKPTGSTLLELVRPLNNDRHTGVLTSPNPFEIVKQLIEDREILFNALMDLPAKLLNKKFSTESLIKQLSFKAKILEALESFLMAYREESESDVFYTTAHKLARETLAFSLANEEERGWLEKVFELVAKRIEGKVPDVAMQTRYGRTLLGVDMSLAIDVWAKENLVAVQGCVDESALFELLWPIMLRLSSEKRLKDTEPVEALLNVARGWISGNPYKALLGELEALNARFPYGSQKRKFTIDMVVDLCEQAFGYEFPLLLAAMTEALKQLVGDDNDKKRLERLTGTLQKRLKYGLPSIGSIAYFEAGFAERVVAQAIAAAVQSEPTSASDARAFVRQSAERVGPIVDQYPAYFRDVFLSITR